MTTSWMLRITVAGMADETSSRLVARSLQSVGARDVRVDRQPGRAMFAFAQDEWEVLRHAVARAGYRPGRVVVVKGKLPAPLPGGCYVGMESGTQEDSEQ